MTSPSWDSPPQPTPLRYFGGVQRLARGHGSPLAPPAVPTRLGARVYYCSPPDAHDARVIARYCRMRHLHPWPYLCHLTDERLALVILRVSTRRRHPRVKAADLIASFLAAGTTAAEYLNRRGFAPR